MLNKNISDVANYNKYLMQKNKEINFYQPGFFYGDKILFVGIAPNKVSSKNKNDFLTIEKAKSTGSIGKYYFEYTKTIMLKTAFGKLFNELLLDVGKISFTNLIKEPMEGSNINKLENEKLNNYLYELHKQVEFLKPNKIIFVSKIFNNIKNNFDYVTDKNVFNHPNYIYRFNKKEEIEAIKNECSN